MWFFFRNLALIEENSKTFFLCLSAKETSQFNLIQTGIYKPFLMVADTTLPAGHCTASRGPATEKVECVGKLQDSAAYNPADQHTLRANPFQTELPTQRTWSGPRALLFRAGTMAHKICTAQCQRTQEHQAGFSLLQPGNGQAIMTCCRSSQQETLPQCRNDFL